MKPSPAPAATLLRDRLDHWARTRPDATAATFGEQTFTWAQWRQRAI
jgi:non-ribosomal peptide synthetase component F